MYWIFVGEVCGEGVEGGGFFEVCFVEFVIVIDVVLCFCVFIFFFVFCVICV